MHPHTRVHTHTSTETESRQGDWNFILKLKSIVRKIFDLFCPNLWRRREDPSFVRSRLREVLAEEKVAKNFSSILIQEIEMNLNILLDDGVKLFDGEIYRADYTSLVHS